MEIAMAPRMHYLAREGEVMNEPILLTARAIDPRKDAICICVKLSLDNDRMTTLDNGPYVRRGG